MSNYIEGKWYEYADHRSETTYLKYVSHGKRYLGFWSTVDWLEHSFSNEQNLNNNNRLVDFNNKSETGLEKAKRMYPPGTKIRSTYSNKVYTLPKNVILEVKLSGISTTCTQGNYPWLLYKGKWSEILEGDQLAESNLEKAKRIYVPGVYFKPAHADHCDEPNAFVKVLPSDKIVEEGGGIKLLNSRGELWNHKGERENTNTMLNRYIFTKSRGENLWAEIVQVEEPKVRVSKELDKIFDEISENDYWVINACGHYAILEVKDWSVQGKTYRPYYRLFCYDKVDVDKKGYRTTSTYANSDMFKSLRKATEGEIKWLKKCRKAGKYVPKEEPEVVKEPVESNLEKARRLYPKGTEYVPLSHSVKITLVARIPTEYPSGNIEGGIGYIYYDGEWAKIVSDKIPIERVEDIPEKPKKSPPKPVVPKKCPEEFKNTKIWIGNDPEKSRKVQEKLYELGFKWESSDSPKYFSFYALYVRNKYLFRGHGREYFDGHSAREIFMEDLKLEEQINLNTKKLPSKVEVSFSHEEEKDEKLVLTSRTIKKINI